MPDNILLTNAEAQDYLNVSHRTLIRWRAERKGPAWTRVGGKVMYQTADLQRFLNDNRVEPVREAV